MIGNFTCSQPEVPERPCRYRYPAAVMLSMFILWIAVFLGIFFKKKWVPTLVIISIIWTAVLLRLHMTDPIPLSF